MARDRTEEPIIHPEIPKGSFSYEEPLGEDNAQRLSEQATTEHGTETDIEEELRKHKSAAELDHPIGSITVKHLERRLRSLLEQLIQGDGQAIMKEDITFKGDVTIEGTLTAALGFTQDVTVSETVAVGDPIGYANGQYKKAGYALGTEYTDPLTAGAFTDSMCPMPDVTGGFLVAGVYSGTVKVRAMQFSGSTISALSSETSVGSGTCYGPQVKPIPGSTNTFVVCYRDSAFDYYLAILTYSGGTISVAAGPTLIYNGAATGYGVIAVSEVTANRGVLLLNDGTTIKIYDWAWDGSTTISTSANDTNSDANDSGGYRMALVPMGLCPGDSTYEMFAYVYSQTPNDLWIGMYYYDAATPAFLEDTYSQEVLTDTLAQQFKKAVRVGSDSIAIVRKYGGANQTPSVVVARYENGAPGQAQFSAQLGYSFYRSATTELRDICNIGGGYLASCGTCPSGPTGTPGITLHHYDGGPLKSVCHSIRVSSNTSFSSTCFEVLEHIGENVVIMWYADASSPAHSYLVPLILYKYVGISGTAVTSSGTATLHIAGTITLSGLEPGSEYYVDFEHNQLSKEMASPIRAGRAITATTLRVA